MATTSTTATGDVVKVMRAVWLLVAVLGALGCAGERDKCCRVGDPLRQTASRWLPVIVVLGLVTPGLVAAFRHDRRRSRKEAQQSDRNLGDLVPYGTLVLQADGKEVFTSPLEEGRPYRFTVAGTYRFDWTGHGYWMEGDARYWTDERGNFLNEYSGLYLDGRQFSSGKGWTAEDRCLHRYTFVRVGQGARVGISLRLPTWRAEPGPGVLTIAVEPLPLPAAVETTTAVIQLSALPVRGLEKEQRSSGPSFKTQVRKLRIASEDLRNWENSRFWEDYARKYGKELLARREDIRDHYLTLCSDEKLAGYIEKEHPGLWARLTGQLEALLMAERLDVAPAPQSHKKSQPDPLKRLSAVAARQRAVTERFIQERDFMAKVLDELTTDEDERERWLQVFEDGLAQVVEKLEDHKEGDNGRG